MTAVATLRTWANAVQVDTTGDTTWEPAVTPPPITLPTATTVVRAAAYDSATVPSGGGKPAITNWREQTTTRLRHRITVNNKDVTYFRGVETPEIELDLSEPLLYDASRLEFPQIHAAFEVAGEGELSWLVKFARVVQQRVDAAGTVVATDYIGFVSDFDHDGPAFACTLGGEAIGRASTAYRPPPIFPRVTDIGEQIRSTLHTLRVPFAKEVSTGVSVMNTGGGWHLDFLQNLCAQSDQLDGTRWTIMPNTSGKYAVVAKDTSTIDATVYFDDALTAPSLRRDFTEEVSRVYITANTPEGFLLNFADYPGLTSAARPDYPMAGSATMPPGTTDADTTSGGGVTALSWKLVVMGYLDRDDRSSTWTTATHDPLTEAVADLQADSGLLAADGGSSTAGTVDPATWNALYDVAPDDYSLRLSRIRPAAFLSYTQFFLRSASGQVIRRNPKVRRGIPVVDAPLSLGARVTRRQAVRIAKRKLADTNASNWVGTITCNGGAVISGEHNVGDALTSDLVMDVRSLRPGMNVWAPLWDGGTLFHISGIRGNVLTVDTEARDRMEVDQIITRNRESRIDPARQFRRQNLSSKLTRDSMTGANSLFGQVDDRVFCPGGEWTVFPVLGAEEGTVQTIHIQTGNSQTVYAVAVFGRRIYPPLLHRLVPDPLGDLGVQEWQDNAKTLREDHWLLYQYGNKEQPAGYFPHHVSSDGIAPDVTGEHQDDAGFPYFALDKVSLWVAVYPIDDTHILPGRILRVQLDDAVG